MSLEQLESEILKLPGDVRACLAETLISSLDDEGDIERASVAEPEQRYRRRAGMRIFTAVVEGDMDTGLYVGSVPGFPGAHSQGETVDELRLNLKEVLEMLLDDEVPHIEAEFIGTQQIVVA